MADIQFQREHNRAVAVADGNVIGECTFQDLGDTWVIDHTGVKEEYGGRGIAKQLVLCVMEQAKVARVQLSATCPYAKKFV